MLLANIEKAIQKKKKDEKIKGINKRPAKKKGKLKKIKKGDID